MCEFKVRTRHKLQVYVESLHKEMVDGNFCKKQLRILKPLHSKEQMINQLKKFKKNYQILQSLQDVTTSQ